MCTNLADSTSTKHINSAKLHTFLQIDEKKKSKSAKKT